jgi:hypothetical protein
MKVTKAMAENIAKEMVKPLEEKKTKFVPTESGLLPIIDISNTLNKVKEILSL